MLDVGGVVNGTGVEVKWKNVGKPGQNLDALSRVLPVLGRTGALDLEVASLLALIQLCQTHRIHVMLFLDVYGSRKVVGVRKLQMLHVIM